MVFVTYQSGPRASDLRTVVLTGKPRIAARSRSGKVVMDLLVGTLAEGKYSAHAWWQTEVFGSAPADHTFMVPAEMVRKVRAA